MAVMARGYLKLSKYSVRLAVARCYMSDQSRITSPQSLGVYAKSRVVVVHILVHLIVI